MNVKFTKASKENAEETGKVLNVSNFQFCAGKIKMFKYMF
jgi:hypothetical protein